MHSQEAGSMVLGSDLPFTHDRHMEEPAVFWYVFAGHDVQTAEPARAKAPAGQGTQPAVTVGMFPGGQAGVHACSPSARVYPALHSQLPFAVLPGGDDDADAHVIHSTAPIES
jgi:hypothetical protein